MTRLRQFAPSPYGILQCVLRDDETQGGAMRSARESQGFHGTILETQGSLAGSLLTGKTPTARSGRATEAPPRPHRPPTLAAGPATTAPPSGPIETRAWTDSGANQALVDPSDYGLDRFGNAAPDVYAENAASDADDPDPPSGIRGRMIVIGVLRTAVPRIPRSPRASVAAA